METQYSKKIEWVKEYVDSVSDRYRKIRKVKSIKSYTPNINFLQHSQAHVIEDTNKKTYQITLNLCYFTLENIKPCIRKKVVYSKIDLLTHLAHELAHLYYWDHCTKHKSLEARLLLRFMKKLERQGYVSEEAELKTKKSNTKRNDR